MLGITTSQVALSGSVLPADRIDFQQEFPRNTQPSFRGLPVPDVRLRLAGVAIEAVPPGTLPNLRWSTPEEENIPTFQWDPPIKRPAAGIETFQVTIIGTGVDPGPTIFIGDVKQLGILQCFDALGSSLTCFTGDVAGKVFDVDAIAFVQFTLNLPLANGDYVLTVRAKDNLGQIGDPASISLTVAVPGLPSPVLIIPPDEGFARENRPLFEWTASEGHEVRYTLQVVLPGGTFDAGPFAINLGGIVETQFKANRTLADATYRWRVLSEDSVQNTGASTTSTFTVDTEPPGAPVLVEPEQGATLVSNIPTFDWEAPNVDGVVAYLLQVTSGGFTTGPLALDEVITGDPLPTQFLAITPLADDIYRWRVIARDRALNETPSAARIFSIDTTPPTVPVPSGDLGVNGAGTNETTPILEWLTAIDNFTATGDLSYDVEVSISRVFNESTRIRAETVKALQLELVPALEPQTNYFWWVRSVDTAGPGNASAFSEPRRFTLDTLAPSVPTVVQEISVGEERQREFTWDRSTDPNVIAQGDPLNTGSGVALYSVVIKRAFLGQVVAIGVVLDEACDPITGLCQFTTPQLDIGRFTIEVNAVDRAGNESPFTDPLDFRAGPVGEVRNLEVVAPVFGSTVNTPSPKFIWNPPLLLPDVTDPAGDGGINRYEVAITGDPVLDPGFGIPFTPFTDPSLFLVQCFGSITGTGSDCTRAIAPTDQVRLTLKVALPDGAHTLAVRVVGKGDIRGSVVERPFTVDTTPPAPPSLVAPNADALFNARTVDFEWAASSSQDIFRYRLQVARGDINGGLVVVDKEILHPIVADRITFNTDDVFSWKVFATDLAGNETEPLDLEVRSFELDTIRPGAPPLVSPEDGAFLNVTTPFFDWAASIGGAETYRLQVVASGDDFIVGPLVIDTGFITQTQFLTITPLANRGYRWRVIARDRALNTASSLSRTFAVDTIPPITPQQLNQVTTGEELERVFTWARSNDPVPLITGTTGDESGVNFYNVVITRDSVVVVVATADDSDTVCPDALCEFTTPKLVPGFYDVKVNAEDTAGNESGFTESLPFSAGSLIVVQNLRVLDSVFGNTFNPANPRFQWDSPFELPAGGIGTYRLRIAGHPILDTFTPFISGEFSVECFGGVVTGAGIVCANAVTTEDKFKLTVDVAVPDGTHLLEVEVVSGLGVGGLPVELTFTVDTTPPDAPALVAPEDNALLNTRIPFFDWEDSAGQPFDYRLQVVNSGDLFQPPFVLDTGFITATQFQAIDDLADSGYQWQVIARDRALNTASSAARSFTVDATPPAPPSTLLLPGAGDKINDNTPLFQWTLASGDVVEYLLQVTSGDINAGPFDVDVVITGDATQFQVQTGDALPDAVYWWRVIARDEAENIAPSAISAFTVDTEPPGPPPLVAPVDGAFLNIKRPLFDWDASTGNVVDYRLQVTSGDINAGPFAVNEVVPHPPTEFQTTVDLGDALYRWRVIPRDEAQNTADSEVRIFTVDTEPPGEPVLLSPADLPARDAFLNISTPLFEWTGDAETYRLQVVRSGRKFEAPFVIETPFRTQTEFRPAAPLADTTYQWRVIARDRAGNTTGSETTRSFTVDTVPPAPPADLVFPGDGAFLNTPTPTFDWEASPSTLDLFDYVLQVTSGGFTAGALAIEAVIPGNITQFQVQPGEALVDDIYLWRVLARDKALNFTASVTRAFSVDTVPPINEAVLLAPGVDVVLNTSTPFFDWRTIDVRFFRYGLQVVVSGDDFLPGSFALNVSLPVWPDDFQVTGDLSDAAYQWRVISLDRAGNITPSVIRSFTVDTTPPAEPVLLSPADLPAREAFLNTSTPTLQWSPGDAFEYLLKVTAGDIDAGPFDIDVVLPGDQNEFQVPVEDALADGTYTWRVLARDEVLNTTGSTTTRTFTVDTVATGAPPLLAPSDGAFLNTGTPLFDWDASAGDVFDYLLRVTSGDLNIGPFAIEELVQHPTTEFQAAEGLADGNYQWSVIARDRALNTASSLTRAFFVDIVLPNQPQDLDEVTAGEELVRVFTWLRSTDPGFIAQGNPLNTGSGVDFYNVEISGPQVVTDQVAEIDCTLELNTRCQFNTPELIPGVYSIGVNAVDRAGNASVVALKDFRAGPPSAVQALEVVGPVFVDPVLRGVVNTATPTFRWNPPGQLPTGLNNYEIAITGDPVLAPDFQITFTSFTATELFTVECLTATGDLIGTTGDACTGPSATVDDVEIRVTFINTVPDGTHDLGVRVITGLDVSEKPVGLKFTVDNTPASPPALVAPEESALFNTTTVDFEWQLSTSGDIANYLLRITSGDIDTGLVIVNDEAILHPLTADRIILPGEGVFRWRVGAKDRAENVTLTGDLEVRAFEVDTTPPTAPVLVAPVENEFLNTRTPLFDWEPSTSDDIFSYRLQVVKSGDSFDGPFVIEVVFADPATQGQLTLPEDATYLWRVGARDEAGNEAPIEGLVVRSFRVDTTPPEPPVVLAPEQGALFNNRTVDFEWSVSPQRGHRQLPPPDHYWGYRHRSGYLRQGDTASDHR